MPEAPHKKRANRAKSRAANPEKWQEHYRRINLWHKFKMTIEDYDKMLEDQNGLCLICERHYSNFKLRLAVDHNHSTGKVRGLLCGSCNSGMGKLQDDVDYLQSAINYLCRTDGIVLDG